MAFDLIKLLTDVFDPKPDEVVTVACDLPRTPGEDTPAWKERRTMALEWHRAFTALGHGRGFSTNPVLTYPSTGANNAELPIEGEMGGNQVVLVDALLDSTLAVFLTQYSATAPLDALSHLKEDFRAASMPGVEKRMERSALAADYREVARRCRILEKALSGAESLQVTFSSGNRCSFDLRFRTPEMDDGFLPRHKAGDRVINLPSGETFIVPYEGEQPGHLSETKGTIPIREGADLIILHIEARTNVAEVAFGCNEWAQVTGNVLEDEKAGFHWAYGRSDHLGGTVGITKFIHRDTVVHQDIVYAKGNPIQVAEATAIRPEGEKTRIIRNGNYVVF
jgi:hypothetical protein